MKPSCPNLLASIMRCIVQKSEKMCHFFNIILRTIVCKIKVQILRLTIFLPQSDNSGSSCSHNCLISSSAGSSHSNVDSTTNSSLNIKMRSKHQCVHKWKELKDYWSNWAVDLNFYSTRRSKVCSKSPKGVQVCTPLGIWNTPCAPFGLLRHILLTWILRGASFWNVFFKRQQCSCSRHAV